MTTERRYTPGMVELRSAWSQLMGVVRRELTLKFMNLGLHLRSFKKLADIESPQD